MRPWIRPALLALGLALLALPVHAQLRGDYETIGTAPAPNSQDTVLFEEYINFTCPHCNNFRTAAQPLKAKYADRLELVNVPILFRGQNDAPLRLFFIAQKQGMEEEIKDALFDATFRYGVNINDPAVVSYLARSEGLGDAYAAEAAKPWVTQKVEEAMAKAQAAGITATPTVVLEGSVRVLPRGGMDQFVANLDTLIGQLLK